MGAQTCVRLLFCCSDLDLKSMTLKLDPDLERYFEDVFQVILGQLSLVSLRGR